MSLFELFIIAIGLSMDAFAVSISEGLKMSEPSIRKSLVIGLYFGGFQAAMPLIGFFIAKQFAGMIIVYDHWIAFALLLLIGSKMIVESIRKGRHKSKDTNPVDSIINVKNPLGPAHMLPLAIATSIDALAVGVSFAFLAVRITPAVLFIGITTLSLSVAGVKIGNIFGPKLKSKAEFTGGIILILIGVKIMLEHLGVISF